MTDMRAELIESYEEAVATGLPMLAADLTWVKVNGGSITIPAWVWDEDEDPVKGQEVLLSDGGPFVHAVVESVGPTEVTFTVPAFARTLAVAR